MLDADFGAANNGEINVVPMNFRRDHTPIPGGEFKEVHMVDLVKKGSNGEATPWNIKRLQQDQILWPYVKPYYDAWLQGQEDPVVGTPLDVLPFLTPGLVQHLKNIHINSAEDLASVGDNEMQRIGMGATAWRDKARAYVEAKEGDGKLADLNQRLTEENELMKAEVHELREEVNKLSALMPKPRKKANDAKDDS